MYINLNWFGKTTDLTLHLVTLGFFSKTVNRCISFCLKVLSTAFDNENLAVLQEINSIILRNHLIATFRQERFCHQQTHKLLLQAQFKNFN